MNAVDRSHLFETIEMSPAAVHDLLARHATDPAGETLVVFETCDCCGWVYDLCAALGLAASVVAIYSWQHVGTSADPGRPQDRAKTAQGSRASDGQGFMDKMEERWRKRRDESGF